MGSIFKKWKTKAERQHRHEANMADKTINANKELAKYSYSKDLEMWNRQNEYNTPTAQMKRFKDGGLNPHLIYSQGSPGNATSMPEYHTPTADYNQVSSPVTSLNDSMNALGTTQGMIGGYQNMLLSRQKLRNDAALEDQIKAKTINIMEDTGIKGIDKSSREFALGTMKKYQREAAQAGISKTQAEIDKARAEIKNIDESVFGKKLENAVKQLEKQGYEDLSPKSRYLIDKGINLLNILGTGAMVGGVMQRLSKYFGKGKGKGKGKGDTSHDPLQVPNPTWNNNYTW